MGIFDIIELRNHVHAITEYLLYLETPGSLEKDFEMVSTLICDHCKKMDTLLAKMEK